MEEKTKRKILRLKADGTEELEDSIAVEKRLNIKSGGKHILSLACTPSMIKELVVGFILTEGIAKGVCPEKISIKYGDEIDVDVPLEDADISGGVKTSGCAGGVAFGKKRGFSSVSFSISAEALFDIFGDFQKRSLLHAETGGVHSAAISDGKVILYFVEDIGRHNAVDKAIGAAVLDGVELGDKIILTSGRLSSEMVSKCAAWAMPLVASRAAPTDAAIRLADEAGIMVVGFLRGRRMNIYSHTERIKTR